MKTKILLAIFFFFSFNVFADITPESKVGTGGCISQSGYDAACWQEAINAAHDSTTNKFGEVVGMAGKTYLINDTIVVCNGYDGVIDGHGATLQWTGGTGKPMFLVVGSYHMRFANLTVQGNPSQTLESAFEFSSITTPPYSSPICKNAPGGGSVGVSSKNSLDHVRADGINVNGLTYGVRFTARYSSTDFNNDMSTIIDSTFNNVMTAAISIEHTQSHQHRFISVNGYAAGNSSTRDPNGCFVNAPVGFFSSTGGFQSNWGKANFCVDNAYGTFDIIESNSEGSNRLLVAGPGDSTGFPLSVNIQGGRFAVNGLNSDGNFISFNRLGPISIRGLHIDGTPPTGVQPAISIQPIQVTHTPVLASSALIEAVSFFTPNSYNWSTLKVKSWVNLVTQSNLCIDGSGYATACAIPLRN